MVPKNLSVVVIEKETVRLACESYREQVCENGIRVQCDRLSGQRDRGDCREKEGDRNGNDREDEQEEDDDEREQAEEQDNADNGERERDREQEREREREKECFNDRDGYSDISGDGEPANIIQVRLSSRYSFVCLSHSDPRRPP